jgi:hypothetical protein
LASGPLPFLPERLGAFLAFPGKILPDLSRWTRRDAGRIRREGDHIPLSFSRAFKVREHHAVFRLAAVDLIGRAFLDCAEQRGKDAHGPPAVRPAPGASGE